MSASIRLADILLGAARIARNAAGRTVIVSKAGLTVDEFVALMNRP